MKKIKIGVAIVAATMILAACNDKEKDIEVDVEGTQQEQPQVEEKPVTEPKAEEQEEKVSEDMYKKSNDKERKNYSGDVVTLIDEETVLIEKNDNQGQEHYKIHPELRTAMKEAKTGDNISYEYYEIGENKVMVAVLFNGKEQPKVNDDTITINEGTFEYWGLADSRSIVIMQEGKEFYPEVNEEQQEYLDKNVETGAKIKITYTKDEYGVMKIKTITK